MTAPPDSVPAPLPRLSEATEDALRARFRHFCPQRSAEAFHEDQPERGVWTKDGVEYPAVVMANAVRWYHDRDRRPWDEAQERHVKSEAPKGHRGLLAVGLEDRDAVTLVEGEGHAVALLSVGLRGVAVAGGVAAFTSNRANGRQAREAFRGKSVRILFDADEPGRRAAPIVARALIRSGAVRVATVFPPLEGADVEDWLGTFESRDAALAAVQALLASADWEGGEAGREEDEQRPEALSYLAWDDRDGQRSFAVLVEDETDFRIATFRTTSERRGDSVQHDDADGTTETALPRAWVVDDRVVIEGRTYVPDPAGVRAASTAAFHIIPPPPYEAADTDGALWRDLKRYYQTHFAIQPGHYSALVAYCLLTWRLDDSGFDHVGFLRFVGRPNTGKNVGLDVMRHTCWRSLATKPSQSNLHRLIESVGTDCTLVVDEFHPNRGRSEAGTQDLVDVLNFSFQRSSCLVRMDPGPRGGKMEPGLYPVFGPKIFASYEADEDEAFARRCIVIPTGEVEVPEAMQTPQFPPEAIEEARLLRARLLAYKARHLHDGLPDIRGPEWRRVSQVAGTETAQVFWPLYMMVPQGAEFDADRDALLDLAKDRRAATRSQKAFTRKADILQILAALYREFDGTNPEWATAKRGDDGGLLQPVRTTAGPVLIPTEAIKARLDVIDRYQVGTRTIADILDKLKIKKRRGAYFRFGCGKKGRASGFLIAGDDDPTIRKAMEEFCVEFPGRDPEVDDSVPPTPAEQAADAARTSEAPL